MSRVNATLRIRDIDERTLADIIELIKTESKVASVCSDVFITEENRKPHITPNPQPKRGTKQAPRPRTGHSAHNKRLPTFAPAA